MSTLKERTSLEVEQNFLTVPPEKKILFQIITAVPYNHQTLLQTIFIQQPNKQYEV